MNQTLRYLLIIPCLFLFLSQAALSEVGLDLTLSSLEGTKAKVKRYVLDNGLRVLFYERGYAPVFASVVMVRVGGVDEKIGQTGISHMLEHMAFKGTQIVGTKNYRREKALLAELEEVMQKESKGIELSSEDLAEKERVLKELDSIWDLAAFDKAYKERGAVGLNATTSKDLTTYYVNFPSTQLEYWAWLESERILNPVMRQFYKERAVVMEERRMRYADNPYGKIYEQLIATAFHNHPYRNPVIGYAEDLGSLTADETLKFHKKYYVPENIVISLVGDVNPERDIEVIKKYFGRLKPGPVPPKSRVREPKQEGERKVTLVSKTEPSIGVAYKKPSFPSSNLALFLFLEVFMGSRVSPLYQELVKDRKIATSVDYFEAGGATFTNLYIVSLTPVQGRSNEFLLKEYDKALKRILEKGFADELLEIAKRSLLTDSITSLKSNNSIARELATAEILYGGWDSYIDSYKDLIHMDKQTIFNTARKYLVKDNRTLSYLEKTDS